MKAHVLAFVTAYNFAKHLKALKWRTPYQVICEAWTKAPAIFKINPHHLIRDHTAREVIEAIASGTDGGRWGGASSRRGPHCTMARSDKFLT